MRTILVDAGPLIALFAADDRHLGAMRGWMRRYSEPGKREMDLADASLYWLATQTGITDIMTVDRNDFQRYRLPDGRAFLVI